MTDNDIRQIQELTDALQDLERAPPQKSDPIGGRLGELHTK